METSLSVAKLPRENQMPVKGRLILILASLLLLYNTDNQVAGCSCTDVTLEITQITLKKKSQLDNTVKVRITVQANFPCESCANGTIGVRYASWNDCYDPTIPHGHGIINATEMKWREWIEEKQLAPNQSAGLITLKFLVKGLPMTEYFVFQVTHSQTGKWAVSKVHYFGPQVRPRVLYPKDYASINATLNGNFSLNCDVTGKPKPNVYWIKLSVSNPLPSPHRDPHVLYFDTITPEHQGHYQCIAFNYMATGSNGLEKMEDDHTIRIDLVGPGIDPSKTSNTMVSQVSTRSDPSGGWTTATAITSPGSPTSSDGNPDNPDPTSDLWGLFALLILPVLISITVLSVVSILARVRTKQSGPIHCGPYVCKLTLLPCKPQLNTDYYKICQRQWENIKKIPIEKLDLTECDQLGQGEFSVVISGKMEDLTSVGNVTMVAIKKLRCNNSHQAIQELVLEASALCELDHPNIIKLYGVHFESMPVMIVFEFLKDGDLLSYIQNHVPEQNSGFVPSPTEHFTNICLQVARGMDYVSSKRLVHCDLAARNCLVDRSQNCEIVIKIGDFGKSHLLPDHDDCYQLNDEEKEHHTFPVKWMPPEALHAYEFSQYSDVWAFGVLMWEVYSHGRTPYEYLKPCDILQLFRHTTKPNVPEHLKCPKHCPIEVYQIMCSCWLVPKENRPLFANLITNLKNTFYPKCLEHSV